MGRVLVRIEQDLILSKFTTRRVEKHTTDPVLSGAVIQFDAIVFTRCLEL
jgi:hypothetical protein